MTTLAPALRAPSEASQKHRSQHNPGEPFVWFTSLGLALGLIMIAVLLGVVIANGVYVFWPKRIVQVETGDAVLLGEIAQKKPKAREWQLFIANREVTGLAFKFLSTKDIRNLSYPERVMVIERLEYGDAIGYPVSLKTAATNTDAVDPQFEKRFSQAVRDARARWAQIRYIEKSKIGAINSKMEKIRLKKGVPDAALTERYEILAKQARELRQKQTENKFRYRIADGTEKEMPVGNVVSYYYPNRLSPVERAGHFIANIWRFLSEEPREANTEGGIFPAIFGTFVMTLLMSVAVVPFGVLAAVYLREYAKQGFFVRSVRIAVNNLAGVPSIVFGVFGLGFFVYFMGGTIDALFFKSALPTPTFGTGGVLWASLTLALMTVPVVIVATEEALAAVPRGIKEGSLACGASKWQTIQRIVLPASAPGIMTGLILAMARGAGEVAPLMLVGVVKLAPTLPLDATFPFIHPERKFMHLGFHIYDLGFQSPDSEAAKPMVFATTLVLILLVVLLNLAAFQIRQRLRKKYTTGAF